MKSIPTQNINDKKYICVDDMPNFIRKFFKDTNNNNFPETFDEFMRVVEQKPTVFTKRGLIKIAVITILGVGYIVYTAVMVKRISAQLPF